MSKFSNILKLIILLQSRSIIKTKELAEALGVSERMIRKYIADLEEANINIVSIPGPKGGYQLKGYDYLNHLDLDRKELVALKLAILEMKKNEKYELYNELQMLGKKINLVADNIKVYEVKEREEFGIGLMSNNDLEKELQLQAAIITRNKVSIGYRAINAIISQRIIRPYALISKGDFRYMIAFCEMRQEIRTFKVIRIQTLEVLSEKFEEDKDFNVKQYTKGQIGLFHDETINLKLIIRSPLSYSISEKIIVPSQEIIWQQDNSIIFKATMTGKVDIIRWLLSLQSYVTILEPEDLKNDVKDELIKMLTNI